jgi:NADH-quinone oxidoreductase subunit E
MSVRRLADESVQPEKFAFSNDNAAWASKRIAQYPAGRQQSAVIPLLMRAQEQEGWVSRPAIESVAQMLGMAYIRVLEVATFYTQFQLQPVGTRAHIQVCGTTPCMLRGAEELRAVCQSKIHHDAHHTNEAGTLSWEEVECLGACVNAPMVAIFADTYEDLTPKRLEEIIDAFAEGKGDTIKPGPQVARFNSAAEAGRTTLLEAPSARREKFVPPVPPEAPAAAAPAAAPAPVAAPAPAPAASAPQEPTTKGRRRDVSEESAPALKGPSADGKVSEAKAEGERTAANTSAMATGAPARAMRPKATGAESKAGKINGGKAVGKETAGAPADGAISAGAKPADALGTTSDTHPEGKVDTAKPERSPRKKPQGDL